MSKTARGKTTHRTRTRTARLRIWLPLFFIGLSALSGCELLGLHGEGTSVEGVVADAVTGEPLEDIWVTLRVCGGCVGGNAPVAMDETDAEGWFFLDDPTRRTSNIELYANRVGYGEDVSDGANYNPGYHIFQGGVESGEHHEIRIELQPVDE